MWETSRHLPAERTAGEAKLCSSVDLAARNTPAPVPDRPSRAAPKPGDAVTALIGVVRDQKMPSGIGSVRNPG